MLTTKFTTLVGCSVPVQQAGMGGVAMRELAAAVADAGGLGMLGGVRLPAPFLTDVLDQLRKQTRGPFGVNFLIPFLDRECLELAVHRARVVEFFSGDPDPALVRSVSRPRRAVANGNGNRRNCCPQSPECLSTSRITISLPSSPLKNVFGASEQ